MRAVLDTNILARAAASPSGPAGERIAADHVLLISSELLAELSEVLGYDWVRRVSQRTDLDIEEFVGSVEGGAVLVPLPNPVPRVVPGDPDDDLVVATAVTGGADVICTLDRHFYQPEVRDYCRERMIEIMGDAGLLACCERWKLKTLAGIRCRECGDPGAERLVSSTQYAVLGAGPPSLDASEIRAPTPALQGRMSPGRSSP